MVENSMTTNEYGLSVSIYSDNIKCATQEVCVTIPDDVDGDSNVGILDVVKITGIFT